MSVEAVQPRLICVVLTGVADSPVGAVGAVVSAARVRPLAIAEYALRLPARSAARTLNR